MTRILIFSPYASRAHLTAFEGTIAKACALRGATVEYLLCDGLPPECDMYWRSFSAEGKPVQRALDLCQTCMAGAKHNVSQLGLKYQWLGGSVDESERKQAFAWAQQVSAAAMPTASFMGHPLGEWVLSSVVSSFRQYPPDLEDWRVVTAYRGFLYSAAIVTLGLNRYLKNNPTDATLLFNGRQSLTRVALEVFRKNGVRVLTHEYPFFRRGHIMVKPNAKCWNLEPFNAFWRDWGNIPLSREALDRTLDWLKDRRYSMGMSWHAFNNPYLGETEFREKLGLSPGKKIFALFTSSTDETAGDPELKGPFESQSEWVLQVVAWVNRRSDAELVIRVHPHLAGKTGLGRAYDEVKFYENLRSAAHANVHIVMPDDPFNSYALMDNADVGLTYGSSVGIEMAMLGKPMILAGRAFYEDSTQMLTIRAPEQLPEILEKSLRPSSVLEIQRDAFRLAYYYVFEFELPFPLVSMSNVLEAKVNYERDDELAPGRDSSLDHICRFLIEGAPVYDSPTPAVVARSTEAENDFFRHLAATPDYLRSGHYDRWLPRLRRVKSLGKSMEHVLVKLPLPAGAAIRGGRAAWRSFARWIEGKKL